MKNFSFFFFLFLVYQAYTQCPGYANLKVPGGTINVTISGSTLWEQTYPNDKLSDDTYIWMRPGTVATSHYRSAYNWGYNFTSGTICGVKVRVEKSAPATNSGTVTDLEARLYNGSSYSPNNYANAAAWPSTDTYFTYGGNSDLWGFASLTATEVNNSSFSFRFRAQRTNVNDSAKIDCFEMTVYSDELLPVELISFDAIKDVENRFVLLTWKCGSEENNDFFTVERSKDNVNWKRVATVKGAGNSSVQTEYELTDREPFPGTSYYRLSQTDFDGTTKILDYISVKFRNYLHNVELYPSIASEQINIKSKYDLNNSHLIVFDCTGKIVKEKLMSGQSEFFENHINISDLDPGIYFVKIMSETIVVTSRFAKK